MEKKEKLTILKCVGCETKYIYDAVSKKCPKCGGTLKSTIINATEIKG